MAVQRSALGSRVVFVSAALVLLTAVRGYCAPQPAPEPVPAWYKDRPSPPAKTNYFYMAESGTGRNEAEAKENAWQEALKNAQRSGAVTVGIPERAVRCEEVLRITRDEYKIYVLFKIQRNDNKRSDVHDPDKDVNCRNSKFDAELKRYNAAVDRRTEEYAKIQREIEEKNAKNQREIDAKNAKRQEEAAKLQLIEAGLADVRRDIGRARELSAAGRKKDALDLVTQCEKRLESLPYYGELQIDAATRDSAGNEISRLRGEISAAKFEMRTRMSFFIDGREALDGARAAGVAIKLKNMFSKKGYEVANDRASAAYHITFEASACNIAVNPYIDMVTCQVCVTAQVTNLTTGGSEGGVDFAVPNKAAVGDDKAAACGKAAEGVADELLNRLVKDVSVFSN